MTYNDLIERHQIRPWLGILPGYDWLAENEHQLDGWEPHVELAGPGYRHSMNLKPGQDKIVSKVMKVNKGR